MASWIAFIKNKYANGLKNKAVKYLLPQNNFKPAIRFDIDTIKLTVI